MKRWLALSALVVALDQAAKFAIARLFLRGEGVEVAPFFNLVLTYNRGAAFSFLADASGWQRGFFIALALAAAALIVWLLRRHTDQPPFCLALALILGGAVGNLIDRALTGEVVDFLDFHAFGWHWPAFNLADSAVTCGAALLIWDGLRRK
ncbi:MAG TPA: signal peptidase II [Burkholderiales bacterium]|nr:signal peptidase II [Burkholderiales bacterium]